MTAGALRERVGPADRVIARLLRTRWLMRAPIPLYRAGLGWMFGQRLVMIEHRGRVSGRRRFVVVELVAVERNAVRVASGFGRHSDWYRNIRSNGVAYLSFGRFRRVRARARLLAPEESARGLAQYADARPVAGRHLHAAMSALQGREPEIPLVEFGPPRDHPFDAD
jgi:deazaflavin-dependent oxidoreductase (nitroreductase family)